MSSVTERHSQGEYVAGISATRVFDAHGFASGFAATIAAGIPAYGSAYPSDATLYVLSTPRATLNGPGRYVVTVAYAALPGLGQLDPASSLGIRQRWSTGLEQVPSDIDRSGNAITNSARNGFDPPPQLRRIVPELTVTVFESMFDISQAVAYVGSVNSDAFIVDGQQVATPGEVLCTSIAPTGEYRSTDPIVEVAYQFQFRDASSTPDPWQPRIPDMGVEAYGRDEGGETVKVPIYTRGIDPQIVSTPVPLNGAGRPYSEDLYQVGAYDLAVPDSPAIGTPPGATVEDTGEMAFLRYTVLAERPFAALGLASGGAS